MESKQTAVKFIRDWIRTNGDMSEDGQSITYRCEDVETIIKQAKVMEEQQIIDAYYAGTAQFDNAAYIVYPKTPEEYYTETYKKDGE